MGKHFKLLRIFALLLPAALSSSCLPALAEREETAEVTLRIVAEDSSTRSSFSWKENELRDVQIVVTENDGTVIDVLYADLKTNPGAELRFTGTAGRRYRLWAAANLGGRVAVKKLSDFTAGTRSVSSSRIEANGIPMYNGAYGQYVTLSKGMGKVDVKMERMLARIDLTLDKRKLEHPEWFTVKDVRICNAIDRYTPFTNNVRQTSKGSVDPSFDHASASDITRINSDASISLYAFENMQGTLLKGNTDPWKKVPSSIGTSQDLCTYMEVFCTYGSKANEVTYRMYLGKDATTNFDVERNTVYRLTLMPSEEESRGISDSWKVDAVPWKELTAVEYCLSASSLELEVEESAVIQSFLKLSYDDGTQETIECPSSWKADASSLRIIKAGSDSPLNNDSLASSLEVTGKAAGEASVAARAVYEGKTYTQTCRITVKEPEPQPVPKLYVDTGTLDTWGGNEYPVRLLYDDGLGNITDVSRQASFGGIKFTGGIPSYMLYWDDDDDVLVAEDWWGRSGSWVTSSPTYTMTLAYNGLTAAVSGTMHGYTRAELAPEKREWHYTEIEDNGWDGPAAKAVLIGSDRTEVRTTDTYVVNAERYKAQNGYFWLGANIPFHASFIDPSNGLIREGDSVFDIVTNVAALHVGIYPEFAQYGKAVPLDNTAFGDGEYLGEAGIKTSDMTIGPYLVSVRQNIWYEDYKGEARLVVSPEGQASNAEIIKLSDDWPPKLQSEWRGEIAEGELRTIAINVNGFSASWRWGHLGSL